MAFWNRRRSIDAMLAHSHEGPRLKATLSWPHLLALGVGAIVGTGILTLIGVGAGLVLGGRLYRGATGSAGEIGHVTLDERAGLCRCGNRGCLETFVSSAAVLGLVHSSGRPLETVPDVVDAALAGDPGCTRVVADSGGLIGGAVAQLCNLLNPQLVVVGGDLARAGDLLLDPLREIVRSGKVPAQLLLELGVLLDLRLQLLHRGPVAAGALVTALLVDRLGRKKLLLIAAGIVAVAGGGDPVALRTRIEQAAAGAAQGLIALGFGFGGDEVREGFGLGEIEAAGFEGAAGEFAGFRRVGAKLGKGLLDACDDRGAAVAVEFGAVFAGEAAGAGEGEDEGAVEKLAVGGAVEVAKPGFARGRQAGAGQLADDFEALWPGQADDGDAAGRRAGGEGEDGARHPLRLAAAGGGRKHRRGSDFYPCGSRWRGECVKNLICRTTRP